MTFMTLSIRKTSHPFNSCNSLLHVDTEERTPMEIVLGTGMGDIDARVIKSSGAPASSATVVLIPDAPLRGRLDLFRNQTADEAGTVHFVNITPGSYKLFAWEDIESGEWWDSEFMKVHEARGTSVKIGEKSRDSVELRSIAKQ